MKCIVINARMIELDLLVLGIVGIGLGWVVGASGISYTTTRFLAVANIEFHIPAAIGTAIGGTAFSMVPAALNYYKTRSIHTKLFATMVPPGVIGAMSGASLISFIPSTVILMALAVLTAYGLVSMLRSKTSNQGGAKAVLHKHQYLREGVIAFGLGLLVGAFGILFTTGRLLAVMNAFKIGPKVTVGTGVSISCVLGMTAFGGHMIFGNVNFLLLFVLAGTGMVGGFIGAKFTNRISLKTLKIILVALLVFTIGYILFMLTNVLLRPSVITCSTCF